VFITGVRSLFFYEKLGEQLQNFIKAHGYCVESPPLPFRSKGLRNQHLNHWLTQQTPQGLHVSGPLRFHFVMSENTYQEFTPLFRNYQSSTFTLISKNQTQFKIKIKNVRPPLSYLLHRFFCMALGVKSDPYNDTLQDKSTEFYQRFLDHCIELAENEDQ